MHAWEEGLDDLTAEVKVLPDLKFDHITVEQGLSNNWIRCIIQDKLGFLWIGTYDGLCRYDGYKFTIFRNDPDDTTSLSSNWITGLYEDSSGDLWISTMGGGLNKFDRAKEQFIPISANIYKKLMWQGNSAITMKQVAEYQYKNQHVLWIGSWIGLLKLDLESQKITHYPHTSQTAPFAHIQTVAVDKSGMVWIGSLSDGLHKFNPLTGQFIHYLHNPADKYSLSNNEIFSLIFDHSGTLWIATDGGGLNRYDAEKDQFISYKHDPEDSQSISSNNLISLYEDYSGLLWVGTSDKGLNIFDRKTKTFRHFSHDFNDPTSLINNTVWWIFEDRSGLLWIGTKDGLDKIVPRKNQFSDYKHIPNNPNSLDDGYANTICISNRKHKEILWIGTRKGLNKIDLKTAKYTHYINDPADANSVPGNIITSIFEDLSGIIWLGTFNNGLIKFDPQKGQFKRHINEPENPNSIVSNNVLSIYEDKQGMLWIGIHKGGLEMFDSQKEIFTLVFKEAALHMLEDIFGDLWVAAWPGLKKYERKNSTFLTYLRNMEAANFPELNRTNFILEPHYSESDYLWTATYSGLNQFDRGSGKFITYTITDGLPSNVINAILEDTQGNLWLSTNNGLSRFNIKNKSIKNFDVNDGLLANQFSSGACAQSKEGEMFFCSSKGVNAFYPSKIIDNTHIPEIVISDFKLFNKSVGLKKDSKKPGSDVLLLNQHISLTNEITLSYEQNVFSFEFTALDFQIPIKNRYAYKMYGFDPDWVYTDASLRFATYMNLDPGEYTFRVKGSNNDGIWNEAGTSIKIIIAPPWWQSRFVYILYFVFFITFIVGIRRYQTNRLKMKNDLEMEHFEAEKLREVDHMKSRFFANISHEFRTPLTLIEGPVRQILAGEFTGNLKKQYNMILRNSNRLLRLVNQILDLSKLDAGNMKLKVRLTNFTPFIKGIIQPFISLAERKKISLRFKANHKLLCGYIDRDKLEKIITNLLSNAFKNTPEKGAIKVIASFETARSMAIQPFLRASSVRKGTPDKYLMIRINNSGHGIPEEQLAKVFDRYYQADETINITGFQFDKNQGAKTAWINHLYSAGQSETGIGLALTRELTEIHYGWIEVESKVAHYISFSVYLPVNKEFFSRDEIYDGDNSDSPDLIEREAQTVHTALPLSASYEQPLLLLVEDNADITTYISATLMKCFRIICAENGQCGLEKAIKKVPDIIISDVMMPVMDGFELCQKIKDDQRTSHIPLILLTAKADFNSAIEGLEFGADDYVTKPFDARVLCARCLNLIEQRKKLREKFTKMIEINPSEIAASSKDEQFLKRLLDVFEKHVAESDFSTEDFAIEIGMSRSNLHRKLRALTNQPAHEFLRNLRLKRAAQLLKKSVGTVSEVAYAVGFNNPSHFSNIFRRQFGYTPSEFAKKNK